jgi:hypothetical protein
MSKHLKMFWASAAALAVSAVLVPSLATAQAPRANPDLAGGPGYRGDPQVDLWGRDVDPRYDDRRDDRRDDWRKRERVDFQAAQASCSRAAIEEAWRRGYYSAQYNDGPKLVEGRFGYEMRGRIRIHDRKGIWTRDSVCELRHGRASDFIILR